MEDSEKRKERLKAMRMDAAQADVSVEASGMPCYLSNPFAEASTAMPRQQGSYAASRFDYYTDPMAAFSANKRNKADNIGAHVAQLSPSLPDCGPTIGARQLHSNQNIFQAQDHYHSSAHPMSPRGMASPLPLHQGPSPEAWNRFRPPAVSAPFVRPFPPIHQGNPNAWNISRGRGSNGPPPNYNPGYAPCGRPNFNHGQGNAQWYVEPGSGRGRGFGRGGNQSFGGSGGRGQNIRSHQHSAGGSLGAERFYDKSMEEDPWQNLKPVLWKGSDGPACSSSRMPASPDSWLVKSLAAKKPMVTEAAEKPASRQSLAEYLAASLSEAIEDEPSV